MRRTRGQRRPYFAPPRAAGRKAIRERARSRIGAWRRRPTDGGPRSSAVLQSDAHRHVRRRRGPRWEHGRGRTTTRPDQRSQSCRWCSGYMAEKVTGLKVRGPRVGSVARARGTPPLTRDSAELFYLDAIGERGATTTTPPPRDLVSSAVVLPAANPRLGSVILVLLVRPSPTWTRPSRTGRRTTTTTTLTRDLVSSAKPRLGSLILLVRPSRTTWTRPSIERRPNDANPQLGGPYCTRPGACTPVSNGDPTTLSRNSAASFVANVDSPVSNG